ncbi:MAG TPA: hypothetical protein VKB26_13455 [Candidatus Acidoferrales bacterium]|nr:hypothetical protein [Candidatus Acidoferrales bacterium]
MPRIPIQQAYPDLSFRWRTANWVSRLIRMPAECVHLESHSPWMATFLPDNLFLRGKNVKLRDPRRPEVSLCRDCFTKAFEKEASAYAGRVVAFEPDPASATQYFFVAAPDFEAAGVEPALAELLGMRLASDAENAKCQDCEQHATWLWFSRSRVANLDAVEQVREAVPEHFCAIHGAQTVCRALTSMEHVNLFYVNAPYGEGGAFLWI